MTQDNLAPTAESTPKPKDIFGKTAIVAVNIQRPFPWQAETIERINEFIKFQRYFGSLIIWTHLLFRPGCPEVSEQNEDMKELTKKFGLTHPSTCHLIINVEQNDIIVRTHRNNAFLCTDLGTLLKVHQIEHVVVFGVGMET
jgi:nicotinamidase-related amidase